MVDMKKFYTLSLLLVFIFFFSIVCYAEESPDDIYDRFMDEIKNYNELSLSLNEEDDDIIRELVNKILLSLTNEIKNNYKYVIILILICILTSLLKIFVSDEKLKEIGSYGCYCGCSVILINSFKTCSDLCERTIDNLVDFMNLSIPTMASLLSFSGFQGTALSMQTMFIVVATIFNRIVVKILFPFYWFCGIFAVINGISKTLNLSRFINLASKTVTYLMGILMTVFGSILAFTGFTSTAKDNLLLKTAKFTVTSFVPVVGGCLSESLNGIIYSSIMLKNTVGYFAFVIILSICVMPVIKIGIIIFLYKICASSANLITENNISSLIDSVCSVLISMLGLVLITSVIFVLFIGTIASIG